MKSKRGFDVMPEREYISGDTLPPFNVEVTRGEQAFSIAGCTMNLIMAEIDRPSTAKLVKQCTAVDGKFTVTLTSEDTAGLDGDYAVHFAMYDAAGLVYRKLAGILHFHPAPKGGTV